MKNVFSIKWLDSYGAQSGWQKIDDYSANKLVITSIGKIVYESDDVISIAGNFSEETEYTPNQANGIMTIPKVSIISISSVSCGPELKSSNLFHYTNTIPKTMYEIINIEMYQRDLMVHFGNKESLKDDLSTFIGESKAMEVTEKIQDTNVGNVFVLEGGESILHMPKIPTDSNGFSILAHEIYHITNSIMEKVGINMSSDSEEAYAYLIQFLTKKIGDLLPITFSGDVPSLSYSDETSHNSHSQNGHCQRGDKSSLS